MSPLAHLEIIRLSCFCKAVLGDAKGAAEVQKDFGEGDGDI